ncbi:MAG: type II secretion system protein GspD [Melioribacter sp.]|jgi:type IV pilus assembly protein PilQ|uniref:type II secretion system protein GspD n=1 Tax=Melioribacter sp. TaxID=2052167 RepID=UPI003BED2702
MKRLIFISVLLIASLLNAQADLQEKLKGYVNPEELVTLSENITFNQAIEVLSAVSQKITGKKIVSTVDINQPIGIELKNIQYKKALLIIVQYNNLMYEETESTIIVKRKDDSKAELSKEIYAPVDEREVKISALLFEGNVAEMRERGINWEFLLSRSGLSIGSKLVTLQEEQQQTSTTNQVQQQPPEFGVETSSQFTMGEFDGDATALFRFFETENLGKIISRPTVSTVNGVKGRTQVGSDISIKERDFAGNIIDRFYSTGTIIEVTPYIYTEDGIDYVYLKLKVERSSANPGTITTEIRKTTAETSVLLLDGEETAIGGLYVNEETSDRRGVPILKDLPWWVLGLRYIFGYDQKSIATKEIIMLIKADILPSLKDRIADKKGKGVLKEQMKKNAEEMRQYMQESQRDKENKDK